MLKYASHLIKRVRYKPNIINKKKFLLKCTAQSVSRFGGLNLRSNGSTLEGMGLRLLACL
jgi:hypothetical protein